MLCKQQMLYHNLASLLEAGVPVSKALRTAAGRLGFKLAKGLRLVASDVDQGDSIAESMNKHSKFFSLMDIIMLRAGDASGHLSEVLKQLAQWHGFRWKVAREIRNGLILPIITLHAAAFAPNLPRWMFGYVSTRELLSNAALVLSFLYIPAIVIFLAIRLTRYGGPIKFLTDNLVALIPTLGKGIYYMAVSRFCRAFNMLTTAGLPMEDTIQMALEATGNTRVKRVFRGALDTVRQRRPASEGFGGPLPTGFLETWQTAELSGTLEDSTNRLANQTEEEAFLQFHSFSHWFPRFVYALIALYMIVIIIRFYAGYFSGMGLM